MPELPEVETIARGLQSNLVGQTLTRVEITGHSVFKNTSPERIQRLSGRAVKGIERHGKALFVRLDDPALTLRIHLGMTGQLLYVDSSAPLMPHTHVVFTLSDGRHHLRYRDARRFGHLKVLTDVPPHQVPDAWLSTDQQIFDALRRKRGMVKHALLGQRVIAGLGNIYVDEALYASKIHPRAFLEKLSAEKLQLLCRCIRKVLTKSISAGGTTISDYVDVSGLRGGYDKRLTIYGRTGSACSCGATIRRILVAGRGTHVCPQCQRAPRKVRRGGPVLWRAA